MPLGNLVTSETKGQPKWYSLLEDPAINKLGDDELPGSLLLRLGLDPIRSDVDPAIEDQVWQDEVDSSREAAARTLRIYVYQGKELAAADDNGLIDAYLKISVGEVTVKTKTIPATTSPQWSVRVLSPATFNVYCL
jgi:hypothetical protein